MKKLLATAAIIISAAGFAAAQDEPPLPRHHMGGRGGDLFMGMDHEMRIQLLKQFDKDGDGRLSPEERAAAMEAIKNKAEDLKSLRMKHAENIIKKFDKDGDGKLNTEELSEFLEEQRKMFDREREKMGRRRGKFKPPADVLKEFDKDGDGELNDEERKAMFEEGRKRHMQLLQKYSKPDGNYTQDDYTNMAKDPDVQRILNFMFRQPPPPPPGD